MMPILYLFRIIKMTSQLNQPCGKTLNRIQSIHLTFLFSLSPKLLSLPKIFSQFNPFLMNDLILQSSFRLFIFDLNLHKHTYFLITAISSYCCLIFLRKSFILATIYSTWTCLAWWENKRTIALDNINFNYNSDTKSHTQYHHHLSNLLIIKTKTSHRIPTLH